MGGISFRCCLLLGKGGIKKFGFLGEIQQILKKKKNSTVGLWGGGGKDLPRG